MNDTNMIPFLQFKNTTDFEYVSIDLDQLDDYVELVMIQSVKDEGRKEKFKVEDIEKFRHCNVNDFKGYEPYFINMNKRFPNSMLCP